MKGQMDKCMQGLINSACAHRPWDSEREPALPAEVCLRSERMLNSVCMREEGKGSREGGGGGVKGGAWREEQLSVCK